MLLLMTMKNVIWPEIEGTACFLVYCKQKYLVRALVKPAKDDVVVMTVIGREYHKKSLSRVVMIVKTA